MAAAAKSDSFKKDSDDDMIEKWRIVDNRHEDVGIANTTHDMSFRRNLLLAKMNRDSLHAANHKAQKIYTTMTN